MPACPVCTHSLISTPTPDENFYDCRTCGKFRLTGTAEVTVPNNLAEKPDKRPVLSHYLRKMQMAEECPFIGSDVVKKIIEDGTLPSPSEQGDNLIRWLGDKLKGPGEWIRDSEPLTLWAIFGAISTRGVSFLIDGLIEKGYLKNWDRAGNRTELTLSFAGWDRHEELKRGAPSGRNAFMAMQYEDDLRRIVDEHFRDSVKQTGFELKLLDDEPRAGLIDDRMRVEIKAARFMICDLTHDNRGAYWEGGYAEGLRKPVIYTCKKDVFEKHGTHFDTNHLMTVPWSEENMPKAMDMLKASIRATVPEAKQSDD